MTGVGPGEWGRVLVSISVLSKNTDGATKRTDVVLDWEFEGDEIPDIDLRVRRRVWSEDPDSLESPMHYEIEQLESDVPPPDDSRPGMRPSAARILAILESADSAMTVQHIGDELVQDHNGGPLKKRTIQAALEELETMGLAERLQGFGSAHVWRFSKGERGDF